MLDRKWMHCERTSAEYINGVKEFIEFAVARVDDANKIVCPCPQQKLNILLLQVVVLRSYGLSNS